MNNFKDIIDQKKIFRHRLYQNDCHLYVNSEQQIIEYFKDVNLFYNRPLDKKIIFDNKTLNFSLNPDNTIPVDDYFPDDVEENEQDNTFYELIEYLEIFKNSKDVRTQLISDFNLRQIAINSKLL